MSDTDEQSQKPSGTLQDSGAQLGQNLSAHGIGLRVLICGGRDFHDVDLMYDVLKQFDIEHVISGHASGADQMAEMWGDENRIPLSIYPADWSRHGKSAGPIRNQQTLDEGKPDLVVAFPGRYSRYGAPR